MKVRHFLAGVVTGLRAKHEKTWWQPLDERETVVEIGDKSSWPWVATGRVVKAAVVNSVEAATVGVVAQYRTVGSRN